MIIQDAIYKGIKILKEKEVEEASLITKLLLSNILKIKREELTINADKEIEDTVKEEFFNAIYKIANGYPIEYIIGKKEFMKMDFYVNENVLVPRADTEILVEEVLALADEKSHILELCTGSGIIAISLAKYIEGISITAIDISNKAIEVAKTNAKKLLENKEIKFVESNMFDNIEGTFDIIVSNPPYIKTSIIQSYKLEYEPQIALDGGEDGLEFYRKIINEGYKYLKKEGKIALEIGFDQKEEVISLIEKSGKYENIYSKQDLFGNDRIIVFSKK